MRRLLKGKNTSVKTPKTSEEGNFSIPVREIFSKEDIPVWQASEAYHQYVSFVLSINKAIQGKPLTSMNRPSKIASGVFTLLDTISEWVDKIPVVSESKASGNAAFRTWSKKLKACVIQLLRKMLGEEYLLAITELTSYLTNSFGEEDDTSYGVGNEIIFVSFICCLFKIGAMQTEDLTTSILKIFSKYFELVRKLIVTYKISPVSDEEARTSIDDYCFLPYVWGSSQLIGQKTIEPEQFLERSVTRTYAAEYIFMRAIQFLYQTKPGEVDEHSGHLWILSGYECWDKVNHYLLDMYKSSVLTKYEIVQQLAFGNILPFVRRLSEEKEENKVVKSEISYVDDTKTVKPSKSKTKQLKKRSK